MSSYVYRGWLIWFSDFLELHMLLKSGLVAGLIWLCESFELNSHDCYNCCYYNSDSIFLLCGFRSTGTRSSGGWGYSSGLLCSSERLTSAPLPLSGWRTALWSSSSTPTRGRLWCLDPPTLPTDLSFRFVSFQPAVLRFAVYIVLIRLSWKSRKKI